MDLQKHKNGKNQYLNTISQQYNHKLLPVNVLMEKVVSYLKWKRGFKKRPAQVMLAMVVRVDQIVLLDCHYQTQARTDTAKLMP